MRQGESERRQAGFSVSRGGAWLEAIRGPISPLPLSLSLSLFGRDRKTSIAKGREGERGANKSVQVRLVIRFPCQLALLHPPYKVFSSFHHFFK